MRFQDWDVLLFPQGSHVPLREFRTACYAQQDPDPPHHHQQHPLPPRSRTTTSATATTFTTTTTMAAAAGVGPVGGVTTPLLTAFVPGLGAGEGFQVSVHSWSPPAAIAGGGVGGGSGAVMQWRVKIVVDGAVVACETFGEEAVWPRQMGGFASISPVCLQNGWTSD